MTKRNSRLRSTAVVVSACHSPGRSVARSRTSSISAADRGHCIPGVVLDALAGFDRGVRGGAHMTDEPSRRELPVDYIPAWPCLIDELDRPMLLLEAAR